MAICTSEGFLPRALAAAAVVGLPLVGLLMAPAIAEANTQRPGARVGVAKSIAKSAPRSVARPQGTPARLESRSDFAVMTVQGTAPDQAGYVHYFVITGPDGEPINHVGIELPGDRIVSSFPDDGVSVAPFVKQGALTTSAGNLYQIEHLYGIRPFAADATMRSLQRELESRVQPWLTTPYCDELTPTRELCVSCLSFAMSVLYPDRVPADFKGAQKNIYTTEDLLMYLAGVRVDAPPEVRSARIAALSVPAPVREELTRISNDIESIRTAETATPTRAAKPQRPATVELPRRLLTRRRS